MKSKWLIAVVAAVVLVGGGAFAGMRFLSEPAVDDALGLAPKDSVVYVNAFLDPSTGQKMALRDLLAKLPEYETPEAAGDAVAGLFDDALADTGLNYREDIEPWVGKQLAVFVAASEEGGDPAVAVLVAADDTDAALAAVEKAQTQESTDLTGQSYEGVDYQSNATGDQATGVVEGFLVAGNEAGFKAAVDASKGESLEDSEKFSSATDQLSKDRLALMYVDGGGLTQALQQVNGLGAGFSSTTPLAMQGLGGSGQPAAAVFFARADALVFEVSSTLPQSGAFSSLVEHVDEPGLVPELPADSWGAFGVAGFGDVLRGLIDGLAQSGVGLDPNVVRQQFKAQTGLDLDEDLLGWMGDLGIAVQGTSLQNLSGGAVISSRNPETSSATVDKLAALAARSGVPLEPLSVPGYRGYSFSDPSMPQAIDVLAGDEVIIAYGHETARELANSTSTLADDPSYKKAAEALGGDFAVSGYVSIPPVVALVESFAPVDPAYEKDVKPFLDAARFVVSGARVDGDEVMQRVVIGIE